MQQRFQEVKIKINNPLEGDDNEPMDVLLMPWIDRGFRVVCVDSLRGEYEARMEVPIMH